MQTLSLIFSVLAILLSGAALLLVAAQRRHDWEQNKKTNGRIDKVVTALRGVNGKVEKAKKHAEEAMKAAKDNANHIADLEQGIVPDFETARKAVDEVNKFNEGIAGILGFDPLNALKQSRQEAD